MRKPLLLGAFFLFAFVLVRAQSIGIQTQYSHTGLSSTLSFSKNFRPNTAYQVGLKFLINQPVRDNAGFSYRHRFYAENTGQHFGISLGIERNLNLKSSAIKPFLFFNVLGTKSKIRTLNNYIDSAIVNQPNPQTVYYIKSAYYISPKPVFAIENVLGIGFYTTLYKQIDIRFAIGASYNYMLESAGTIQSDRYYAYKEFGDFYSVGLTYRISK